MSRDKGKKHGVVKYKVKSFSIDIETIEKMDQKPEINYSNVVNRFLSAFVKQVEGQRWVNPNLIIDRLLGDKEDDLK